MDIGHDALLVVNDMDNGHDALLVVDDANDR